MSYTFRGNSLARRKKRGRPDFPRKVFGAKRVRLGQGLAAKRLGRMSAAGVLNGLGLELKYLDCAWNAVTVNQSTDGASGEVQPSSGCTGCLSMPSQGDGETQRDGRKFTVKSIWVSGAIDSIALTDQGDAVEDRGVFVALVLDTQANAATIVSENVYLNPGTGSVTILPQPLRNLKFSKRYRVLDSRYVAPGGMYAMTDGASTGSLSNQTVPIFSLNWKGSITCLAASTTADVVEATDNAFHVIAFSGGGTSKTINMKSRMRFLG